MNSLVPSTKIEKGEHRHHARHPGLRRDQAALMLGSHPPAGP